VNRISEIVLVVAFYCAFAFCAALLLTACEARQDMPDDEAMTITHIVQGWK
jgi:hypothetical protein